MDRGVSVVLLVVLSIIAVVIVLVPVVAVWRIFTKAGRPGWAAIIPFYNIYVLLKVCGRPGWWLVLFLIPGVNVVFAIIAMLDLAASFGKSTLFAVFGLIWPLPPIGLCILGFGSARYLGPGARPHSPLIR